MNNRIIKFIVGFLCISALCVTGCTKPDIVETDKPAEAAQGNEEMDAERIYMESLGNYLKEQLDLKLYDEQIAEFDCIPVDMEEQVEYQKDRNMGLRFIYLRNELHLERLSDEDRQLLAERMEDSSEDAQDLVTEMVVRTFEQCLSPRELTNEEDKAVQTIYDEYLNEYGTSRMVNMNSVVLQIATQSEYDEQDNILDDEKEAAKEKALLELAERMENEMEGLLGEVPIRVFVDPVQ